VDGGRSSRSIVVLAAIAVSASIALLPWLRKPPFPDEGASLHAAGLGWTALWRQSGHVDLVLLPYYSLLHLWAQLSPGIGWARCLSVLAFGLTVFLTGYLGVRLGGRLCGVLAAVVAATSPLLVTAALSARPYALSALAATAAVVAFLHWLEGGGSRWAWWFGAASIATLLLHLFAVLAPLSVLVATVALEPGRFRGRWRGMAAPLGLVAAVALSLVALGASQRRQLAWIPSPFEGAQLTRALRGPAGGGHGLFAVLMLGIAVVAVATCLRAERRHDRRVKLDLRLFGILLTWALLPTAALVAGSLVEPLFVDRYVTASVPGLALALALPVAAALRGIAAPLTDRSRVRAAVVLGAAAVVLFVAFSVPAARLTYREAISQGPAGERTTAVPAPVVRTPQREGGARWAPPSRTRLCGLALPQAGAPLQDEIV
jgi:mannosyltransferase